jgi:hypothetical protein
LSVLDFRPLFRISQILLCDSILFDLITGESALSQESQNLALHANSNVNHFVDGNLKTFGKPIVAIKGDEIKSEIAALQNTVYLVYRSSGYYHFDFTSNVDARRNAY